MYRGERMELFRKKKQEKQDRNGIKVGFYVSEEEFERLRRNANIEGRSVSGFIRARCCRRRSEY
jgi:hypothetical protein